jgi:hypothetical protein
MCSTTLINENIILFSLVSIFKVEKIKKPIFLETFPHESL